MSRPIAENIERFRAQLGISKGELARRLNYKTVQTVVYWTTGTRVPTVENVRKLAEVLKCRPIDLDPEGVAPLSAGRKGAKSSGIQKQHTATDSPTGTRTNQVGELMAAALPPLPDGDLLLKVLGVWLQLDTADERNAFVAHARGFLGSPAHRAASGSAKKVRR